MGGSIDRIHPKARRQAPVLFHQDLQVIFDRYSCQDLQGWSGGGRRRTRTGPGLAGSFPSGPGKYGLEVRTRPEYARRGEGRPGAPPQCPHTGAKADTNLIDMNLSAFSYTGLRDSCQDLQAALSGIRTRTCWNGPRGLSAVLDSAAGLLSRCSEACGVVPGALSRGSFCR